MVAFAGTINPTSGSVSVFVPIEHAILARSAVDAVRTKMFARYSLIGAFAGAVGSLAAATPDFAATLGVSRMTALKAMFVFYALLGVMGGMLYRRIPKLAPATEHKPVAALGPSRSIVYKLAGPVQHRRLRRWFCSSVIDGPLALRQVRPVAGSGQPVLLLIGGILRVLISGRCLDFWPCRPSQYDGLHAHTV
jgi:hypothetical protein